MIRSLQDRGRRFESVPAHYGPLLSLRGSSFDSIFVRRSCHSRVSASRAFCRSRMVWGGRIRSPIARPTTVPRRISGSRRTAENAPSYRGGPTATPARSGEYMNPSTRPIATPVATRAAITVWTSSKSTRRSPRMNAVNNGTKRITVPASPKRTGPKSGKNAITKNAATITPPRTDHRRKTPAGTSFSRRPTGSRLPELRGEAHDLALGDVVHIVHDLPAKDGEVVPRVHRVAGGADLQHVRGGVFVRHPPGYLDGAAGLDHGAREPVPLEGPGDLVLRCELRAVGPRPRVRAVVQDDVPHEDREPDREAPGVRDAPIEGDVPTARG